MLRIIPLFLAAALAFGQAQTTRAIKWACIGNSITEGSGASTSYPLRLGTKLGPAFQIENDGVSGCTLLKSGDKPYWTQGKLANVFALKPDIITIKLGTNDSKSYNWGHKAEFARDLQSLIDTLGRISPKPQIWLCLPVPAFTNTYGISGTIIENEQIPLIKQVAQTNNLNVIDCHTLLLKKSALFPDGVHPNDEGADSIATAIFRAFKEKATRVACIGNSITDYAFPGSASDAVEADAYPIRLNMLLGRGYYVENDGVTGLYLQKDAKPASSYWGPLGRLPQVFALKPNIITVKLGTNDSRAADWNTERYLRDYRALVDTLRGISSLPVVWASLPVPAWQVNGAWPYSGISNDIIKDSTIPAIRKVSGEKSLSIIDPNTPFQNLKSLVPDGVHPNKAGQDSLAHIFYRALTAPVTRLAGRRALRAYPEASLHAGRLELAWPGELPARWELVSLTGKILGTGSIPGAQAQSIPLQGLSAGSYFLSVISPEGVAAKRFSL
ncbi:MAG: GDSL-type esterase/lipase family protein [Fibrobacteria bacterium]